MNKTIGILVMSLMAILMAGTVYGALAIDKPDANEYVAGTYTVNGTAWAGDASDGNCSNISVDYRVSGAGSYTDIGVNYSLNNITTNWKIVGWVTKGLMDNTTYSMRARCINSSNSAVIGTATEVQFYVNNGVPVLTLTSPTDLSKDTDGTVTFTYACVNASSAQVYYDGATGFTNNAMTKSSDVCTYSANLVTNGFHSWYMTASDGYDTTTSAVTKVEIRRPGGPILDEAGNEVGATTTTTTPTDTSKFGGTFGLIVFGAIIWYFIGKGKKKK